MSNGGFGITKADGTYWAGNFTAPRTMAFTEQESDVVWEEDKEHI